MNKRLRLDPGLSGALRHWHPVLASKKLKHAPVGIKLCGVDIVLFRGEKGAVFALIDRCPHRKMQLSRGAVVSGRIVCPYHAWSFDGEGQGMSPGNPQLCPRVLKFETRETHGYVWVRRPGLDADLEHDGQEDFPQLEFDGYQRVHDFSCEVDAPFNLLVDNMAELEHTISVHDKFGFALEDLPRVVTRTSVQENKELEIYYEGPQRPLPRYLTACAGLRGGDTFVQFATIRFGPVHSTYELLWRPRGTKEFRPFSLRFVIFYNPVDERTCTQFAFVYVSKRFGKALLGLTVPILKRIVEREIRADVSLVGDLTEDAIDSRAHTLGRFDHPLISARTLIRDRYFSPGSSSLVAAEPSRLKPLVDHSTM